MTPLTNSLQDIEERRLRWRDLIRRIEIRGPMPVRFDIRGILGELILQCEVLTWDREHQFEMRARYEAEIQLWPAMRHELSTSRISINRPQDQWVRLVEPLPPFEEPNVKRLFYLVARAYEHELLEFMHLDGRRWRDPHSTD